MKRLRSALRLLVTVALCALLAVGGWLGYTAYTQGSRWLTSQYNSRLTTARRNVRMGAITDKNGVTLASTDADGQRVYSENKQLRRAVSQIVGDQMSMSGTGVETFHAGTLLGLSGSIIDRTWQYLTGAQTQGDNIKLTIDASLEIAMDELFPDKYDGAVVLINYQTGEILAMYSTPGYDPSALATRSAAADQSGSGYVNRCLQGQYAPGSVFKLVTLAGALAYLPDMETREYTCTGSAQIGDGIVRCAGGEAHGKVNLSQAVAQSCNCAFAQIALDLGAERLQKTAEQLGFNDNFKFRDLILYESTFPTDIASDYELAWTGVGQGRLLVTPLHMAMIAGAIANGGVMQTPQLISQVYGVGGIPRVRAPSAAYKRAMTESVAELVEGYMRKAVLNGTARRAAIEGYTVCGKTGTAEVSNDKRVPENAWFVGYVKEAPYAVAVIVEGAGSGGTVAAPIGGKVLKKAIAQGSGGS